MGTSLRGGGAAWRGRSAAECVVWGVRQAWGGCTGRARGPDRAVWGIWLCGKSQAAAASVLASMSVMSIMVHLMGSGGVLAPSGIM